MEPWITIVLGIGGSLVGAGAGYGLTLGRLRSVERDVERIERVTASKESVDGIKLLLEQMRADLHALRNDMHALLRARGGTTNPGD